MPSLPGGRGASQHAEVPMNPLLALSVHTQPLPISGREAAGWSGVKAEGGRGKRRCSQGLLLSHPSHLPPSSILARCSGLHLPFSSLSLESQAAPCASAREPLKEEKHRGLCTLARDKPTFLLHLGKLHVGFCCITCRPILPHHPCWVTSSQCRKCYKSWPFRNENLFPPVCPELTVSLTGQSYTSVSSTGPKLVGMFPTQCPKRLQNDWGQGPYFLPQRAST